MITKQELLQTVQDIRFRNWTFTVVWEQGRPLLFVEFYGRDNETWQDKIHKGRKWRLSCHMTKSEIVQTALKAVLTALEHEAREQFLYRGAAVYGPHLDVEALWVVAQSYDLREEIGA